MVVKSITKSFQKVFGTRNDRLIKAYRKRVIVINDLEDQIRRLTDAELKAKTVEFQKRIKDGQRVTSFQPEVMAVAREVMDRAVGIRSIFNPEFNFDPDQLKHEARKAYDKVKEEADQLPAIEVPGHMDPVPGWMQVEIPNIIYENVREIYPKSRPPFRARPFDVQLIGGMVLGEGKIAEMKTGEGKTIVAPLACYLACVEDLRCYVITVNDYLVQRDRDWVFPFFHHLGLTVGAIHPSHMLEDSAVKMGRERLGNRFEEFEGYEGDVRHLAYTAAGKIKSEAYECNVVYGTNSEFGFDYLRDNMKTSYEEQVQHRRDFCIIDEVDSILIDEARTPLIISGAANDESVRYELADRLSRHLEVKQRDWAAADHRVQQATIEAKALEGDIRNSRDKDAIDKMKERQKELNEKEIPQLEAARDKFTQYYETELDKKAAHLTSEGVEEAQREAGIGSFYVGNNIDMPHLLENSLRAHVVFKRDKDYVVQNGEIVIVDENTGRLMIGRQWSDGLHQAIEAKEKVKIKEETQTMATVTIQNYLKLFKRLAGMTGTAITEANEFYQVYQLDVVCIPTNLPVIRDDRNDLIYMSAKDKWYAVLDNIRLMHDIGRPVLVGTTSVEKSEYLSDLLTKKHGIKHSVLNAKAENAAKEGDIVADAGRLGAVMIATNMAGRGTDIKLAPIERKDLVKHWKERSLLPQNASADMDDDKIVELAYRYMAVKQLGYDKKEADNMDLEEIRHQLMQKWVVEETYYEEGKVGSYSVGQCEAILDDVPNFLMHKLRIFNNIEELGGLHIIGTERHESRRIDNQLRGRAGRQGDHGSSRFFISLEDDLMQMFANKTMLSTLSKLGMKEGDAIEHSWLTKSIERAQRKVEERHYESRKNLVEYDEVMETQRGFFYGLRQDILEGKGIEKLIREYLAEAVDGAVEEYLDRDYIPTQISEYVQNLTRVSIDPTKLRATDLNMLLKTIEPEAQADIRQTVETTLGEYIHEGGDPDDWNVKELSAWVQSSYKAYMKPNELKRMNFAEITGKITEAALAQFQKQDLTGIAIYLEDLYAQKQLAEWAENKFDLTFDPKELSNIGTPAEVADHMIEKVLDSYREREIVYPIEFVLENVADMMQQAANAQERPSDEEIERVVYQPLCEWAEKRYSVKWQSADVMGWEAKKLYDELSKAAHEMADKGLEAAVSDIMRKQPADIPAAVEERFGQKIELEEGVGTEQIAEAVRDAGWGMLRKELTMLERFVLLQILDNSWKDHLYAMDQLRDSVWLQSHAEKDPRIEYKRQGGRYFKQMIGGVQDQVTDLIFRARIKSDTRMESAYAEGVAQHAEADSAYSGGQPQQQQGEMQYAGAGVGGGSEEEQQMSRKQRRAQQSKQRKGSAKSRAERRRG